MPSFRILTFGCKVNQCDSQVLRETLSSWGLAEADSEAADVVIINTCTVTGGADAKFRKALRRIKRESPQTAVAVTGCLAKRAQASAEAPRPLEKSEAFLLSSLEKAEAFSHPSSEMGEAFPDPSLEKAKSFPDPTLEKLKAFPDPPLEKVKSFCHPPLEKGDGRGISLSEADLIFPSKDLSLLARFLSERNMLDSDSGARGDFHAVEQSYFAEHTRAFLKIQDGCDCFCSYCIVPFVRPNLWSEEPARVIAAINELSAKGYKEAVLAGIHLGFYGREQARGTMNVSDGCGGDCPSLSVAKSRASRDRFGTVPKATNASDSHSVSGDSLLNDSSERDSPLVALLAQIETHCSIERVRLSSLEVNEATDELVDLMAHSSKICRHLHLPLQSGDSDILKRMNRRYSADFFTRKVSEVRKKIPDIGITTDIIVGFPGETEEQFQRTCRLVEELQFAKIHVFRYSRRPGTCAATLDSAVNEISRRGGHLIQVGEDAAARYKRRFIGKTLDVLVETHDKKGNRSQGLTSNYIRVQVSGTNEGNHNEIVPVRIQEINQKTGVTIGIKL